MFVCVFYFCVCDLCVYLMCVCVVCIFYMCVLRVRTCMCLFVVEFIRVFCAFVLVYSVCVCVCSRPCFCCEREHLCENACACVRARECTCV